MIEYRQQKDRRKIEKRLGNYIKMIDKVQIQYREKLQKIWRIQRKVKRRKYRENR